MPSLSQYAQKSRFLELLFEPILKTVIGLVIFSDRVDSHNAAKA